MKNINANVSPEKQSAPFVLFVDDEPKALKVFENTFNEDFNILTAASPPQALTIMEAQGNDIAVVMSDQRMPEKSGVELLKYINKSYPDVVLILTSAYSDMTAAIDAYTVANVSQYVTKPWDIEMLHKTLHKAVNKFLSARV